MRKRLQVPLFILTFALALSIGAGAADVVSLTSARESGAVSSARESESRAVTEEVGRSAPLTASKGADASDNNDALFYEYLKRADGVSDRAAIAADASGRADNPAQAVDLYASDAAGKHLQGFDRKLYDLLKAEVVKVAAGGRESTIFRFTPSDLGLKNQTWTAEELGVTLNRDASGQLTDATWNAVWEPLYRAIGHNRQTSSAAVMDKLLVDCPFELYWFAKSHDDDDGAAAHWTYHWSVRYNEGKGFSLSDDAYLDVEMMVAENYAKSADDENYYNYQVNTEIAKKATQVAAGAKNIVAANSARSDFEKLTAYRDAICDLVSYDYEAAQQGSEVYGNGPWQILRVFDGNPDSNVVCEGYAKAFQYLCELSNFQGDVASYIITGDLMDQSGRPQPHMWNHVRIDGRYWLVDLTNCDVENVSRDWLFFKAPYDQTVNNGKRTYAFARNGQVALRYTNLENAYEVEEVLILAERDYASAVADPSPAIPAPVPDNGGASGVPDGGSGSGGTPDGGASVEPDWMGLDWSVTYPVTVTNGAANFAAAPQGLAVSVQANPAPLGKRFLSWGGALGLTFTNGGASSASATFIMPAEPLYLSAVYEDVRFSDVPEGAYYDAPVSWAVAKGITNGTSPTTFNPADTCTRAQILTFLYRAAGEPEIHISNPFPDVSPDVYYYRPALWAAERALISGYSFDGDTPCTRSAVMLYLWKLAGSPIGNYNPFEDVPAEAEYAQAVAWAVSRGVTTGTTPTTFNPHDTCTRAQIVTFLYRYLEETGAALEPDEMTAPPEDVTPENPDANENETPSDAPENALPDAHENETPISGGGSANPDANENQAPSDANPDGGDTDGSSSMSFGTE